MRYHIVMYKRIGPSGGSEKLEQDFTPAEIRAGTKKGEIKPTFTTDTYDMPYVSFTIDKSSTQILSGAYGIR